MNGGALSAGKLDVIVRDSVPVIVQIGNKQYYKSTPTVKFEYYYIFSKKTSTLSFRGNLKEKEMFSDLLSAPPSTESRPSHRILVVDDEKALRNQHVEVLASAGYEVIAVRMALSLGTRFRFNISI